RRLCDPRRRARARHRLLVRLHGRTARLTARRRHRRRRRRHPLRRVPQVLVMRKGLTLLGLWTLLMAATCPHRPPSPASLPAGWRPDPPSPPRERLWPRRPRDYAAAPRSLPSAPVLRRASAAASTAPHFPARTESPSRD